MKINVCQVIPVPECEVMKGKITCYNEHSTKWGSTNGVKIVETAPEFTLGTGEIDDLYFAEENETLLILNRLGVIKLLSTIRKQCPGFRICRNWECIKKDLRHNNQTTHQEDKTKEHSSTHSTLTYNNHSKTTFTSGVLPHPRVHTAPHPGPLLPSPCSPENLPSHRAPQTTQRQHYMNDTSESTHIDSQHTDAAAMRRTPRNMRLEGATPWNDGQGRGDRDATSPILQYGERWQGGDGGFNSATVFHTAERYRHAVQPYSTQPYTRHQTRHSLRQDGADGFNAATAFHGAEQLRPATHPHPTQPYTKHRTLHSPSTQNYTGYRQGCYNCGEHNHRNALLNL